MLSSVVSEGEFNVVIPKDFCFFFHSEAAWVMPRCLSSWNSPCEVALAFRLLLATPPLPFVWCLIENKVIVLCPPILDICVVFTNSFVSVIKITDVNSLKSHFGSFGNSNPSDKL